MQHFPIDVLKVDRSFVVTLGTDDHARRVLTGLVALAHALGLPTVAEGVETRDQARLLTEMGMTTFKASCSASH